MGAVPLVNARPRPRGRPSVRRGRAGVRRKTAFGVPAAAQISAKAMSRSSMSTIGFALWPTGGTPPIAKPVASRTKSASARTIGSPTASGCFLLVDAIRARGDDHDRSPARLRRGTPATWRSRRPRSRSRPRRRPRCGCSRRTRAPEIGRRARPELSAPRGLRRASSTKSCSLLVHHRIISLVAVEREVRRRPAPMTRSWINKSCRPGAGRRRIRARLQHEPRSRRLP